MVSVSYLVLNKKTLKWLQRKGIKVPEKASFVDHIFAPETKAYTEMFTFRDGGRLRLTQQKNYINQKTKKKEVQFREYEYTNKGPYRDGKIAEIRQTTVSNGEEIKETWRFYHPKDDSVVRFSHKGNGAEQNNYLQSDGIYVDRNGLRIRPISNAEYLDKQKDIDKKRYVGPPWTMKQSITTEECCNTDAVQECTVVGIYGKKGISLNHLNPSHRDNYDFEQIESELMEQLQQQGNNAKAFVIGSCESYDLSDIQFANIIDLFATENVPFSKYKTGDKVLYGPFKRLTVMKRGDSEKYGHGIATHFEWQSGQHLIYDKGEIQLANPVIDSELKKGVTDPATLIKKSFCQITKK